VGVEALASTPSSFPVDPFHAAARLFLHASTHRYFAVVGEGLEATAARELERHGATDVSPTRRGLHFVATPDVLARVVVWARVVGRILAPLESFACHSDRYLRRRVTAMPWEELMDPDTSFAVSATLVQSTLRHTQYAVQLTKDGICDRFRDRTGRRPDVDRRAPDLRVHVHVQRNKATVSLDCGAGARHRRGYRTASGDAPLPETVAAALFEVAGDDGRAPLLDPMCGSGTLLAEALLRRREVPPTFAVERFGCERLPAIGDERVARARASVTPRHGNPPTLQGNDVDPDVLETARANLQRVPFGETVSLTHGDFRDHPGLTDGLVVANPPYGVRLGDRRVAQDTVRALGDFLKTRCAGSTAWLVLGDRELLKHVGLRTARRIPVRIGGLDGRFARYDLY